MKSSGGDASDDGPKQTQRLIKLGIAVVAALILYGVGSSMFGDLLSGTRRSKLTGDCNEISKAIERWELDNKKPFLEWEIDRLVGTTLGNAVRDPDGRPYLYDWFFRRFVYLGPDGLLQTLVPGKTTEPGESDDEVRPLAAIDRLVYARAEGAATAIELANADGSNPKQLALVTSPVLDVSGLPTKDANLVALTLSTTSGTQLAVVDIAASPAVVNPLTRGDHHDACPALSGVKTEWIFYQSDMDAKSPDKTHVYKISYKDKSPARMTAGDGGFGQPAVELRTHWVWYTADNALWRFQLSNYGEPQRRLSGKPYRSPAPSASGDFLAYLVADTLEVIDTRSNKVVFTAASVVPDSRICWSPDDSKIGYLVSQDGQQRMVLSHVAKNVTFTVPGAVTGRGFAWLHD